MEERRRPSRRRRCRADDGSRANDEAVDGRAGCHFCASAARAASSSMLPRRHLLRNTHHGMHFQSTQPQYAPLTPADCAPRPFFARTVGGATTGAPAPRPQHPIRQLLLPCQHPRRDADLTPPLSISYLRLRSPASASPARARRRPRAASARQARLRRSRRPPCPCRSSEPWCTRPSRRS